MAINFNDITDTATPSTGSMTVGGSITAQNENLIGGNSNWIAYSQQIGNGSSAWTNSGTASSTLNSAVAPDSTSTASTISNATDVTLNGNNVYYYGATVKSATTFTFSCYIKFGTATTVSIATRDNSIGTITTATTTSASAWTRVSVTYTTGASTTSMHLYLGGANGTFYAWGAQLNPGSSATTYVTTTVPNFGYPYIQFNGTNSISIDATGALSLQPAGTGALQAQATTSSATGGNARGANAVDWSTARYQNNHVASGAYSVLAGGYAQVVSGSYAGVLTGNQNIATAQYSTIAGGVLNNSGGFASFIGSGQSNSTAGYYNFIGGGFTNSGTSGSSVTTQSGTMNGTTAVTLSGSNASIKVGQYITGTSIASDTYVAAISGTSLTLSKNASGSSTNNLNFYTPHGVVVGGGNNTANGSYSFVGGGGDAGTAANRNLASGAWSAVVGGRNNTASGNGSFVGGGGYYDGLGATNNGNSATGDVSVVGGGILNQAPGFASTITGGQGNYGNGSFSTILGNYGSSRGINGAIVLSASVSPLATYVAGNSQSALLVLSRQTTDATATVLTSNTLVASGTNQVILPNNAAYYFKGSLIANVTGAADGAAWSFEGAIMRGSGVGTTVLIGTPTINRIGTTSGASLWSFTLTADTTNGGLAVTVTGLASTTIRWVCKVETTEVTF